MPYVSKLIIEKSAEDLEQLKIDKKTIKNSQVQADLNSVSPHKIRINYQNM